MYITISFLVALELIFSPIFFSGLLINLDFVDDNYIVNLLFIANTLASGYVVISYYDLSTFLFGIMLAFIALFIFGQKRNSQSSAATEVKN